jgi:hypothetical protein
VDNDESESIEAAAASFVDALGDDREAFNNYLNALISSRGEGEKFAARTMVSLFLLAFLFEVFSSKGVTEAEFLSIKLSDFGLVRIAIPVVMSAMIVRVVSAINSGLLRQHIIEALVTHRFPGPWTIDFYRALSPDSGPLMETYETGFQRTGKWVGRIQLTELIVTLFAPVIFLFYAFWRLYSSGDSPILTTVSLVLCVALLLAAMTLFSIEEIPLWRSSSGEETVADE